jgi:hypothetical protein
MEKSNYRFYIQVRLALGIDASSIHSELRNFSPTQAPSFSTVKRWCWKFREGNKRLEDKPRAGRPIYETLPRNISLVKDLIDEDPYISYDQLEAKTLCSRGTLHTIITIHLKLRKITSRWAPHELTQKNKDDRVRICIENLAKFEEDKWRLCGVLTGDESWFYLTQLGRKQSNKSWVGEGQSPRIVIRPSRFAPKFMFTIFFKRNGVVHISRLKKGKTINYISYINDTLKPLVNVINLQRPSSGAKTLKFHLTSGLRE